MTRTPDSGPVTPVVPSTPETLDRLQMPLVDAMMTQRTVRRLLPDPVDDELVKRCIELALRAPTAADAQNWEFIVVKDRRVKERLARQYRLGWSLWYRVLARRVARDPAFAKTLRSVQWQVDHFTELPVLVVACLRLGVRGGRVPFIRTPHPAESGIYGSVYPAVQNLLLAARAMGLGASLITMPLLSVTWVRRILGLPQDITPFCIVPLGWPRGRYGPATRKPVGEVVHFDAYGNRAWLQAEAHLDDQQISEGTGPDHLH